MNNEFTLHLDDEDLSRVEYWYEHGVGATDDVLRFFYFYLAFNYIYCSEENHYRGTGKVAELTKIEALINYAYDYSLLDGIKLSSNSELCKEVMDNRNRYYRRPNEDFAKANPKNKNDMQNIFAQIYQVRCNLFHGSKRMRSYRDCSLVRESADILETFIGNIIKHCEP